MRHKSLESHVQENLQAWFGGGLMEKARSSETSPAAYPTLRGLRHEVAYVAVMPE
jgi:hypothetical protein